MTVDAVDMAASQLQREVLQLRRRIQKLTALLRVLPHAAFRAQTPDEMYLNTGATVPTELEAAWQLARQSRAEANRQRICIAREPVTLNLNCDGRSGRDGSSADGLSVVGPENLKTPGENP